MRLARPPLPFVPAGVGRGIADRRLLAAKCAAAAGAAWLLARWLTGAEEPYYAPMTAFLMIQPTVAASFRDSGQYLAAAVLGAAAALGLHAVLPAGAVALAVTVAVAVLLGGLPGLGSERVTVSFWALFTLVVGGAEPWPFVQQRLPEAAIGVGVGLLVNLLVVPPVLVAPAEERLGALRRDLAEVLVDMASDVRDGWPPGRPGWGRALMDGLVAQSREAVTAAEESLRWNPRGRAWQSRGRAQQQALERLEHVALAVRALSRLLLDAAGQQAGPDGEHDCVLGLSDEARPLLAAALAEAAAQVRGDGEDASALRRLRHDVAALHHQDPALWLVEGAAVVELERIDRETRALAG